MAYKETVYVKDYESLSAKVTKLKIDNNDKVETVEFIIPDRYKIVSEER
jgi:hypothetical protein